MGDDEVEEEEEFDNNLNIVTEEFDIYADKTLDKVDKGIKIYDLLNTNDGYDDYDNDNLLFKQLAIKQQNDRSALVHDYEKNKNHSAAQKNLKQRFFPKKKKKKKKKK